MASTLVLVTKLISMMLEAAVGFLIVRVGICRVSDTKMLSRLVIDVFTPCLIIDAFQIDLTSERLEGFIAALILSFAYFPIAILFTRILQKPLKLDEIDRATIIYPNVGNLILPLVSMVLGENMVFYASGMQIPFNLFVWTHGVSIIEGEKKINLKKAFLNTNVISIGIGVIIMLTGFKLPDVISTPVSSLGDIVGPLSMMVIGMQIADSDIKDIFTNRRAYPVIFLRLIVLPCVMLLIMYLTGIPQAHPSLVPVLQVTFMAIAAPPAATVSQLAILRDNKPLKASICNMLGVIFCIVTIPLINALYGYVFA